MSDTEKKTPPAVDAAEVQEKVRELGKELKLRASEVKSRAAVELNTAAERIRIDARESGDAEAILRANQVAGGLERASAYLNSRDLDQIGEDVTHAAQQNIWQSLGIAFVVGLIVGMLLGGGRRS